MQHICFDDSLQKWFDFKIPKTTIDKDYIEKSLSEDFDISFKPSSKIIFIGKIPTFEYYIQSKKGMQREMATLFFVTKTSAQQIQILRTHADWLLSILRNISVENSKTYTLQEVKDNYEAAGLEDFELFWDNKPMNGMRKVGLLRI